MAQNNPHKKHKLFKKLQAISNMLHGEVNHHCVKRVQIRSFFSLKTDKYGPENSVFGHFSRSAFDVEFDCKKVFAWRSQYNPDSTW